MQHLKDIWSKSYSVDSGEYFSFNFSKICYSVKHAIKKIRAWDAAGMKGLHKLKWTRCKGEECISPRPAIFRIRLSTVPYAW